MMPPQPTCILMTTDAVGGVWVYASSLARALCENGYLVTLVVMGPAPRPEQVRSLENIAGLEVEVTDLALEWRDPTGSDIPRAREVLSRIAERVQPDVVHLNSFREAEFDWPAPVLIVGHSCVWTWSQACRGRRPVEPEWELYAASVASSLDAASAWVAPTAAFRNTLQNTYRPRKPGEVIWNGASLPSHHFSKEPLILAAGRLWDEAKGIETLAEIAPQLPWPVCVAGPARGTGLDDRSAPRGGVDYLGVLSHPAMLSQMRRAGIFTSPALYEPFGLSVLEAAASGCALVLTDIPSFRELWTGAALFVAVGDQHALQNALQLLCDDEERRKQLQSSARTRVRRYSLEATTGAYRDLYARLMVPFHAPPKSGCNIAVLQG